MIGRLMPRGLAGGRLGRLRLASGLVLMAFVTTHLLNHALLLVSLPAAEAGRVLFGGIWGNRVGFLLLVAAGITHLALALWRLQQQRSWRMPLWQWCQLGLGLAIPLLLAPHVTNTMVAHRCCGIGTSYAAVLLSTWQPSPWQQMAIVPLVWLHGCIGLHFWLRLRPVYRRLMPLLLVLAVLLPVLALIGYVQAARDVTAQALADPAWLERIAAEQSWPSPALRLWLGQLARAFALGFVAVLLLLLVGDVLHARLLRRGGRFRLTYDGGRTLKVARGTSVLEASRLHGIPHAAVCGGRGRCSTCRVRVSGAGAALPPPSPAERRVLERIGAGPDVRLACQLRPTGDLRVARLMPADADARVAMSAMDPAAGREREIVVLFADLRDFTRLAERRLPYDLVYLLNRYFAAMGGAIEAAGGHVDKFIGDGIMALFGIDRGPELAARQALAAAGGMATALRALNRDLEAELVEPLRIGIGMHAGPAIVGEMGFGRAVTLTAIGDTVNIASRLEALTKELGAELVVSVRLLELADAGLAIGETLEVDVRGRRGKLLVKAVGDASLLEAPPVT